MSDKTKQERLKARPGSGWEETLRIVEKTPNGATGPTVWHPPTPGERQVRPPAEEPQSSKTPTP